MTLNAAATNEESQHGETIESLARLGAELDGHRPGGGCFAHPLFIKDLQV